MGLLRKNNLTMSSGKNFEDGEVAEGGSDS